MCNIREVGNMNNTVSLTKQNGEKIQAEIISYFEIAGTQKRYLFYTLNEAVENGLVKYYSIRDGKFRLNENDIDEVVGYIACKKTE